MSYPTVATHATCLPGNTTVDYLDHHCAWVSISISFHRSIERNVNRHYRNHMRERYPYFGGSTID